MKKMLILCILLPALCNAQDDSSLPRIQNDTLITTSGFKIYEGMQLKLGVGTMPDGSFKFIRISETSLMAYSGTNQGAVNSANAMKRSASGMTFKVIRIDKRGSKKHGYVYYPILGGGSRYEVDIENAIPVGEVVIPDEYKPKKETASAPAQKISVADELIKLKKLLDDGVITQEEFDAQKKKLLEQ
jgi:hypothetical protein